MTIQYYIEKFGEIRVHTKGGHDSPHKICMLLALLDLARAGDLRENRIYFGPALLERYSRYFSQLKTERDHPNPHLPFFHLQGRLKNGEDSFWHLKSKLGHEQSFSTLKSSLSYRGIIDHVQEACLDNELFQLLQDESNIDLLSEELKRRLLKGDLQKLAAVANEEAEANRLERDIRRLSESKELRTTSYTKVARDSAFRRVISSNYNYRCAATGTRLILKNGIALVEAAHIIPFSVSRDNRPQNGIALTKDMHWAMDNNVIAPGDDYRWHISTEKLDELDTDHKQLIHLKNQPIILPADPRLHPDKDACAWRLEALRKGVDFNPN